MVHPETNSLLVLYDDAQSINRRKARLGFSFAEVGIQARDQLSAKEAEEDAIPLVAPQSTGRSGSLPELRSFAGGFEARCRCAGMIHCGTGRQGGERWKFSRVFR